MFKIRFLFIMISFFAVFEVCAVIKEIKPAQGSISGREFSEQLSLWLKKHIVEHYKERHKDNIDKLSEQIGFLNKFCDLLANTDNAFDSNVLFEESKKYSEISLDKNGVLKFTPSENLDAIFPAASGILFYFKNGVIKYRPLFETLDLFQFAYEKLLEQEYFPPFIMCVADLGGNCARLNNKYAWDTQNIHAFISKIEGLKKKYYSDSKLGPRFAYYLHYKVCVIHWDAYNIDLMKKAELNKDAYFSWFLEIINGDILTKKAWKARGYSYASKVSPQGWKDFKKYELEAEKLFRKAWEKHPDFPEPCAKLIGIANTGYTRTGEGIDFWMQKSIDAQIDYIPSYQNYFWAKRPRWGGSYKEIMQFAWATYNSGRFDTVLPRLLIKGILDIVNDDNDIFNWRKTFREPKIKEAINKMYSEMLADKKNNGFQREVLNLEYACCSIWMGNFEKASELRSNISDYIINNWNINYICCRKIFFDSLGVYTYRGTRIDRELAIFNGVDKKLTQQWDKTVYEDEDPMAEFELYDKLMDPDVVSDVTLDYFVSKEFSEKYLHNKICEGFTVLGNIISDLDEEVAIKMVEKGADINNKSMWGNPPVSSAAAKGYEKLVKLLFEKGAKVNGFNLETHSTPVYGAINNKNPKTIIPILKMFLEKKPDLNTFDWKHETPLTYAIHYANLDAAKLLLEYGADPNVHETWAPIHYAANFCNAEMIDDLIKYGADVNLKVPGSQENAGEITLKYGYHTIPVLNALIKHKLNLNAKDSDGNTLLHIAVQKDNDNAVKLLLEAGADKTVKNNSGKLPVNMTDKEYIKKLFD